MVHASVSGWQESLVSQVRKTITGSQLPEHRKTVLYRVNARRQWWSTEVELPWKPDCDTGELMPCTAKEAADDPDAVWLPVDAEDLKLLRHMAKHAQRRHRYPALCRVDTLVLDSIVARGKRGGDRIPVRCGRLVGADRHLGQRQAGTCPAGGQHLLQPPAR